MKTTDAMRCYLVEPRDTLVVRDGRPARSDTIMRCLDFPLPSSLAGLARSEIGFDAERVFVGEPEALKRVPVAGPWLVELDDDRSEVLGPAPADAGWMVPTQDPDAVVAPPPRRIRRAPQAWPEGTASDLPSGLLPVRPLGGDMRGKPPVDVPGFWRWTGPLGLGRWLFDPPSAPESIERDRWPVELGPTRLLDERRTHVSIEGKSRTARDGALFATTGLRLTRRDDRTLREFGLAFGCASDALAAKAGTRPVFLGGERRMSRLRPLDGGWPEPGKDGIAALSKARRLRVMLLTPGIFSQGFRPSDDALSALLGEGARLVAAAVDRPTVVSGFDIARAKANGNRRGEKAVRRAAPAGSVYWVDLPRPLTTAEVEAAWMASVCDDEQDRLDGFGRVLLGVG